MKFSIHFRQSEVTIAVTGKMEYKYHTSKTTWDDAQLSCKRWGGNLITISSSSENDQVVKESKSRWVKVPLRSDDGHLNFD